MGITPPQMPALEAGIKYAHAKFLEQFQKKLFKELGEQWADSKQYEEIISDGESWKSERLKLVGLLREGYTLDAIAGNNLVIVEKLKDDIREFEGFSKLLYEDLNNVHKTLSDILIALAKQVQMKYQTHQVTKPDGKSKKISARRQRRIEAFKTEIDKDLALHGRVEARQKDIANRATYSVQDEIRKELNTKHPTWNDEKISDEIIKIFKKDYNNGKVDFTEQDLQNDVGDMGWDYWKHKSRLR